MINPAHSLVKLAEVVDWQKLDQTFGETFSPGKGDHLYQHTVDGLSALF